MIASLLIALQLAAALPVTGYEASTVIEAGPGAGQSSTSAVAFTRGEMRMDMLAATGPTPPGTLAVGSYMLVRGNPRKMYMVDPAKREYYELNVGVVSSQMTRTMQSAGATMSFSEFKFSVEDLGDGESMLGHPTRHWRQRNTVGLKMVLLGDS